MAFLFRAHLESAHEVFEGYTPVHPNADWPKSLVRDHPKVVGRSLVEYGYYTEPLIGFAREMAALEDRRFDVYSHLFMAAMRYDRIVYQPPALSRFPLLN